MAQVTRLSQARSAPGAPSARTGRVWTPRFVLFRTRENPDAAGSQASAPRSPRGSRPPVRVCVRLRARDRDRREIPKLDPARQTPRAGRLHLRVRRQDRPRRAARGREPRRRRLRRHRPVDEAGDRRGRGPPVLGAQRRRHPRDRPRRLGRRPAQGARPGRLDDHAAVRQEHVLENERTISRKLQGGGARVAARAALVEGPDPHRLPEHDLLRQRRVRRPDGRARLLRQERARPDARRGGAARRHPGQPVALRPVTNPGTRATRRTTVLQLMLEQG